MLKFDFTKLTAEKISYTLFFYAAVISPGFIFFYLFHREFFNFTDWIKLLFLSVGISLPFLIFNTLVYSTILAVKKNDNKDEMPVKYFKDGFLTAAWATFILFYSVMGVLSFFKEFNSILLFLIIGFAEILFFLILLIMLVYFHYKHKKSSIP